MLDIISLLSFIGIVVTVINSACSRYSSTCLI
jgi:hypothetical protein